MNHLILKQCEKGILPMEENAKKGYFTEQYNHADIIFLSFLFLFLGLFTTFNISGFQVVSMSTGMTPF